MTSAATIPRATSASRAKPDQICAEAIDEARAAIAPDRAGAHIEVVAEGERIATHYFEADLAGYRGWRWAVTVARTPRSKQVTICEIVLLPGPDALTTPEWVPWNERLQPGDLGVGDLMPTAPDDERLVPGYLLTDDPEVDDVVWEIGLGRVRVLSLEGRLDAAERWYDGDQGPTAAITTAAPPTARCVSCGFYLPLAGAMKAMFGACANVYAPDDGRVVSADHGCGAHSEVLVEVVVEVDEAPTIYDDAEVEPVVDRADAEVVVEPVEADLVIVEEAPVDVEVAVVDESPADVDVAVVEEASADELDHAGVDSAVIVVDPAGVAVVQPVESDWAVDRPMDVESTATDEADPEAAVVDQAEVDAVDLSPVVVEPVAIDAADVEQADSQ